MSDKKPTFEKPTRVVGPADLAELKATDALLDRLAAGGLSDADREDPLVAAFAELRVTLDEPSDDARVDVARLIEVLGDRPLYLVDAEEATDDATADSPINLGRSEPAAARKVIDVRDGALRHARQTNPAHPHRPVVARQPAGQVAGVAARVGGVTSAAVGATVRSIHSITAGRRAAHGRLDDDLRPRWQQIAGQVALPAASVIALLVVGSGVSAAVTGDPMAPVAGMSKVVQQLPGINNGPSPESVKASIVRAGELADEGRPETVKQAQTLLANAGTKIDDLPKAAQPAVQQQFDETKAQVEKAKAASAKPSADPTVSPPAATPAPTPAPAPSVTPTPAAPNTTDSPTSPATPSPSAATTAPTSSAATAPAT